MEDFRARFGGEEGSHLALEGHSSRDLGWPLFRGWVLLASSRDNISGRDCFGFLDSNLKLLASQHPRVGFPSWAAGGNGVVSS